jgi:hypothetical protein
LRRRESALALLFLWGITFSELDALAQRMQNVFSSLTVSLTHSVKHFIFADVRRERD